MPCCKFHNCSIRICFGFSLFVRTRRHGIRLPPLQSYILIQEGTNAPYGLIKGLHASTPQRPEGTYCQHRPTSAKKLSTPRTTQSYSVRDMRPQTEIHPAFKRTLALFCVHAKDSHLLQRFPFSRSVGRIGVFWMCRACRAE